MNSGEKPNLESMTLSELADHGLKLAIEMGEDILKNRKLTKEDRAKIRKTVQEAKKALSKRRA